MTKPVSSRESMMPGNIVRLNEPYPVDEEEVDRSLKQLGVVQPWNWTGFTHGIVAELIGPNASGLARVSLYLYSPELKLIYLNSHDGLPVHVDFCIDE